MLSILAPAIAAVVVACALGRWAGAPWWLRRAAALPALGAGYAAGHFAALGAPAFPPVDTTQSLVYLAAAAAALGLLDARATAARGGGRRVPRLTRTLAIVLVLGLSLHPLARYQWSVAETCWRLAALALAAVVLWRGYDAVDAGLPAVAARASWIAVFAGAGLLLLLSRSALLGQLATAVAVALAALTVAPGLSRASAPPSIAVPFLAPMLHALVANGAFYAQLGVAAAIALAVSPLAAAASIAVGGRRGVAMRATLAVVGVAVVLAPFVARAAIAYAADNRGYDY